MTAFWLIAAAMLLAALAVILPPLLQRPAPAATLRGRSDEAEATVAVYRERLADLEREYARGHLGEADYAAAQAEAKRELLQYVPDEEVEAARTPPRSPRWAPLVIALAVPAVTLAVYAASGRPDLLTGERADRLSSEQVARYSELEPRDRIPPLESYLSEHPAAPQAWALLASAYRSEERFRAAADAYGRAIEASGTADARLVARQAEALLLANDRRFTDHVQQLIEASLEVDPRNPLGLMLAGHAALTRGDNVAAANYWRRLAEQVPENDRRRQLVDALIARAEDESAATERTGTAPGAAASADNGPALTVRLRLAEELRAQVEGEATVFVFAHADEAGNGAPLAVQRTRVSALPTELELSDAQAMMAGRTLSSAEQVVVTARVSRSGDVAPASGDLEGHTAPLPSDRDEPVDLTIDSRVE